MKTTDSVMREKWEVRFDKEFGVPKKYEPKLHSDFALLNRTSEESACEMTKESIKMAQSDNMIELYNRTKDFIRHSLAEARREEREQRDSAWKKIIACHNCSGTGRTDNIGGAMECIECGGQCHNLVRYDGIHIDDLLTGDNPERKEK